MFFTSLGSSLVLYLCEPDMPMAIMVTPFPGFRECLAMERQAMILAMMETARVSVDAPCVSFYLLHLTDVIIISAGKFPPHQCRDKAAHQLYQGQIPRCSLHPPLPFLTFHIWLFLGEDPVQRM